MAKGLFTVGFTVAEVLAIQARAKADLLAGKVLTSYSEGGVSASKQIVMSPEKVLEECKMALQFLDPVTYPKPKRYLTSDYSRGRNL
jgi:hypothetical protein